MRLFALRTKGEIEFYDISNSRFEFKARYTRLRQDLSREIYDNKANQTPEIVSIAAIGAHESKSYCLVAITADGTRVYFNAAPFIPALYRRAHMSELAFSEYSLYSSGTMLGVQLDRTSATPSSLLHVSALNIGRQAAARENSGSDQPPVFQEFTVTVGIPAEVWSIVEVSATSPASSPPALCHDGIALNPLAQQMTTRARSFLILATSGIHVATMPRPIDILQATLGVDKDSGYEMLKAEYGRTQVTAMGISIGAQADPAQVEIANVISSILLNGGEPMVRDSPTGREIIYSSRHDGLALTVARYLRTIWSAPVLVEVAGRGHCLGVTESVLLAVQSRLDSLKEYTDEHPFPSHRAEGEKKIAWDQEELSLDGLYKLIKQASEAISFMLLLNDYKLPDLVARCGSSVSNELKGTAFRDLFTSQPARNVAKKLVTALIEQQIGQELGVSRSLAGESCANHRLIH